MKLEEVEQKIKKGEAEFVEQAQQSAPELPKIDDFAKFITILEVLRRPRYHLITPPTFTPKNFLEQIQFYENGATRRIYFYINGSWRYAALT